MIQGFIIHNLFKVYYLKIGALSQLRMKKILEKVGVFLNKTLRVSKYKTDTRIVNVHLTEETVWVTNLKKSCF